MKRKKFLIHLMSSATNLKKLKIVPNHLEDTVEEIEEHQKSSNEMKLTAQEQEVEVPAKRSVRFAGGVAPSQRYIVLTKIKETAVKMKDIKEKAKFVAIQQEVLQIFDEWKAVNPVMKHYGFEMLYLLGGIFSQ
jgi:hypothetical protein